MADKKNTLVREEDSVRPSRRRRSRARDDDDDDRLSREDDFEPRRRRRRRHADGDDEDDDGQPQVRRRARGRRGRPPLRDEFTDLGRGSGYAATETMAVALDIASRVLRGVVDNALDEDYSEPGDVVRGFTNEADLAAYDLVDELRRVPRRLDRRCDEGIRSPRAERGERKRHEDD